MKPWWSPIVSRLPPRLAGWLRSARQSWNTRHVVDETEIVASLARRLPPSQSVLVDVGAHEGLVSGRFLDMGWSVIAYEPDPMNRRMFREKLASSPRLQLSSAAVSDKPAESATFFSSTVSSGISSLAAFHASHEATDTVEVVTLAEDLRARHVTRVDFLKIDIEGFDYFALRGFDWAYAPTFVLYEFEDRKTLPLGYSLADSSTYLADRGYQLVYSVWEPIVEYGAQHKWRGLFAAPPPDAADCWGNVFGFSEAADAQQCLQTFGKMRRW